MFVLYIETNNQLPLTGIELTRITVSCEEVANEFAEFLEDYPDVSRVVSMEVSIEESMNIVAERDKAELQRAEIFMQDYWRGQQKKVML